ncbi:hypothetical protein V6N13_082653 [Hibiscus sabdariffa]
MNRRCFNHISSLKRSDGSLCTDQEELLDMAYKFYKDLFSSSGVSVIQFGVQGQFRSHVADDIDSHTGAVSDDEIRAAFFDMGANKAPESIGVAIGSRLWNGLSVIWNGVRSYARMRVGNGFSTDFWRDCWILHIDPLIEYVPGNLVHLVGLDSVASMVDGHRNWLWFKFQHLLQLPILLRIAAGGGPVF